MKIEQELLRQVRSAKTDNNAADELIRKYMPFIKAETAKFLKRPPVEGHDDELSIALIAFHEAIESYEDRRGAFLPYAGMLIRSRLLDYARSQQRHSGILSLDRSDDPEEDGALMDTVAAPGDHSEEFTLREATRGEILELTAQLQQFGVSLADVADHCPQQSRTLAACGQALQYARGNRALMDTFLRTKKLPLNDLAAGAGVERKTLERHRKYMVALLLIYTNGYEIIRGHLKNVLKGGATA